MKTLKEKIGFIGCGNMGSAILEGLLKNRIVTAKQISVFDPDSQKLKSIQKKFGVRLSKSNDDLFNQSQILILAIKPQELMNLAKELKMNVILRQSRRISGRRFLIISILAGTPISKIKKLLGGKNPVVRAMPNLGAKVSESMTALAGDLGALSKAKIIFSGCGGVIELPEKYFDLFTAASGSGPAYFFLLMEILARFLERNGISKKKADQIAVQTALGAGKLANILPESPDILRKRVTSKGGTTEAALSVLFKKGIQKTFNEALGKAVKRAKELSK